MNSSMILKLFTAAVGEAYAEDPSRAGLVLSQLDDNSWYASVVRYRGAAGSDKRVVAKVHRGSSFEKAVEDLAREWVRMYDRLGEKGEMLRAAVDAPVTRFRLLEVD